MYVIVSKWHMKTINMNESCNSYAFPRFVILSIRIMWKVFCVIIGSSPHLKMGKRFVSHAESYGNNRLMASSSHRIFNLELPYSSICLHKNNFHKTWISYFYSLKHCWTLETNHKLKLFYIFLLHHHDTLSADSSFCESLPCDHEFSISSRRGATFTISYRLEVVSL